MPVLKKLVVQDFRNISLQELAFSPNINCIWGGNGEGKTNLLDAVHYLAMTKSGTQPAEKYNFRHGCKSFAISGLYGMEEGPDCRFSIQVTDGAEKKIRRDDKPVPRISEHIGTLPVVMVSPSDIELVSESGDERRRFFNAFISQLDRQYLADVQQYNRLLTQRNRLLKDEAPDLELLETFDHGMAAPAKAVHDSRARFAEEMLPVVSRYYEAISGGKETVGIDYRSDLSGSGFEELMARHRTRDLALRYTVSGIQRDDFLFTMEGFPIRRCGSQGQQKSFLVALKFAQYEIMKKACGTPPVLLLDDLFDKLDLDRVGNLLQMVAGNDFGQIFISDTNKTRTEALVDKITSDRAYFKASAGTFTKIDGDL
ncbi:MAG: DNA replication and repair protein RecF [Bacteroidales bacterium]|nr:DNA replication and repair protein RecF [Bacteroidales bacterium]